MEIEFRKMTGEEIKEVEKLKFKFFLKYPFWCIWRWLERNLKALHVRIRHKLVLGILGNELIVRKYEKTKEGIKLSFIDEKFNIPFGVWLLKNGRLKKTKSI